MEDEGRTEKDRYIGSKSYSDREWKQMGREQRDGEGEIEEEDEKEVTICIIQTH